MKRKEAVADLPLRSILSTMRAKEVREALDTLMTFGIVYEYWVDDWHLIIIYDPDEDFTLGDIQ